MNFIAIDFETANRNRSSICQVGIAEFENGECIDNDSWLIDPGQDFDEICIGVHGITPEDVEGSPTFDEFYELELEPRLEGKIVVCHTSFDRVALEKACRRHRQRMPKVRWLDSATLARRVWPEVSRSGFGLKNFATVMLKIDFEHHDAGEDARAAGLIVLAAATKLGLEMDACLSLVSGKKAKRNDGGAPRPSRSGEVKQDAIREEKELRRLLQQLVEKTAGLPDPPLAGEIIVVTGRAQIEKKEIAIAVEQLGGSWNSTVTARTTMLVVGTQNLVALKGQDKSSNHRKAESWIEKGHEIQIFSESEWLDLLREIHQDDDDE